MADRQTSRRDAWEAKGYLIALFEGASDPVALADQLIKATSLVKVQRATDMLVLYFALADGEDESDPADDTTTSPPKAQPKAA